MTLAIFDLDNTLLNGDSDHAWGEFLIRQGLVDEKTHRQKNDGFYQDYLNGTLDIYEYQRFVLSFLKGHSKEDIDAIHLTFMSNSIQPLILSKARELIGRHREEGHTLMIITATSDFITAPVASHLGIPHLIATQAELQNGHYTGEVSGTPSFHDGKVTRLNAWLKAHNENLSGAYFYSDSHNDLPLLSLVDNPVAVDPDEVLEAHALSSGWPVISLRD